mgnify:CR=1 FL=1
MMRMTETVKQLLIINIIFFIGSQLVSLAYPMFSLYYPESANFKLWQILTHMFMHGSVTHIAFNMFALYSFGSTLEHFWGGKKFLFFYMSCAIGAFIFYNFLGAYELWKVKDQLMHLGYSMGELTGYLTDQIDFPIRNDSDVPLIESFLQKSYTPMVGASGAIFGIMAGFAYLFPNTELQMMFFPMPIKAKYLIGGYFLVELYLSFQQIQGDNVAHLAHVGGAVIGFIFVFIWNRNRKSFY